LASLSPPKQQVIAQTAGHSSFGELRRTNRVVYDATSEMLGMIELEQSKSIVR
jgi:hypothetical protein